MESLMLELRDPVWEEHKVVEVFITQMLKKNSLS
ncbi:MAG: hypothetical protein CM15mP12_8250 [Gammaproteobacteria bacterium]|nr:MAG: hypothetical protein CM15mP12_8250 [Gammaproteobacteria bacterium]